LILHTQKTTANYFDKMGKRIERIFPDQFSNKITQILGSQASVINRKGETFKGVLEHFDASLLKIKVNSHKYIDLEIAQIAELQIEAVSTW
jgi:hypothetical protein